MRIISGGQTGADQAGWRAAKRMGIPTCGWMPKCFMTEDGYRPEFARLYGARETVVDNYPERTRWNIVESDATLLFDWHGTMDSAGARLALKELQAIGRPYKIIKRNARFWPPACAAWLQIEGLYKKTINIAGNRESKAPGVGAWVEQYLWEMFWHLGYRPVNPADNP